MKKIFLIMFVCILLVGIASAEVFTFDNILNYKDNDMTVDIINTLGFTTLGTIELKSHSSVNEVLNFGFGEEEVVMYYDFTNWELYENGLGEVYFIDMNTGKEIEKDYYFVEWKEIEIDVNDYVKICDILGNKTEVNCVNELIGNHKEMKFDWVRYDSNDIPNRNVRIGLKTYVGKNDYVDGVWTIAGKKIKRHITWSGDLDTGNLFYYKLDEAAGDVVDATGTYDGTNQGAIRDVAGATAGLGRAFSFEGNDWVDTSFTETNPAEVSISFWVKLEATNNGNQQVVMKSATGANGIGVGIINDEMRISFAGIANYDTSGASLTTGWHFLVFTIKKNTLGGGKFYLDGSLIDTKDLANADANTVEWELGRRGSGDQYLLGDLDEVGMWNRLLSEPEISFLWNDGDGRAFGDDGFVVPTVTLNTPVNTSNFTTTTINFGGVVSDTINLITNVSLIIDDVYIETNTSGINNSNYTFSETLSDGDYTWTYEGCNNLSLCINGTTRSFTIDTTIPEVIILTPLTTINHHLINTNLSVNWSANDTNIDTCILQFEGVNRTVTCSDNTTQINITNIINKSIIFYVNDTFGHMNSTIRSWSYTIFENSQTFNDGTLEGTIETFTANITIEESNSIAVANFIYNGTSYVGTHFQSGNYSILTIDITILDVDTEVNSTFFWSLLLADSQIINLTSYNQTVSILNLDDCSVNTVVLYNYTIVDEGNQSELINTTAELNINLLDIEREIYIFNFSLKYSNINSFAVCINENISTSTFVVDSIVKYESLGYSIEYYNIVNAIITNTTIPQEITLYDLISGDATDFKITFKAEDFTFVENALIFINRQYIAENNTFKTVELPKTDSNGQTVGHFVRNDVLYNIVVIKDGVVLGNFENQIAFCEDVAIGNCQMVLEATPEDAPTFDYNEQLGIIFQSIPTYNENTSRVSFSFSTDDGTVKTVLMNVTRDDIFGNRTICSNTLTSSSGTLSCLIPAIDESVLRVEVSVDGQPVILSNVTLEASDYGNLGYVLWFFLTFVFILIFGDKKSGVLIGIGISFIGAIALGVTRGNIIGIGSAGIWMLVIIILGIIKLNKEKPQ